MKLADAGPHSIHVPASAFLDPEGKPLHDWVYVTGLIFTPANKELPTPSPQPWNCEVPAVRNLRWEGGDFVQRPESHAPTPPDDENTDAGKPAKGTKKGSENSL